MDLYFAWIDGNNVCCFVTFIIDLIVIFWHMRAAPNDVDVLRWRNGRFPDCSPFNPSLTSMDPDRTVVTPKIVYGAKERNGIIAGFNGAAADLTCGRHRRCHRPNDVAAKPYFVLFRTIVPSLTPTSGGAGSCGRSTADAKVAATDEARGRLAPSTVLSSALTLFQSRPLYAPTTANDCAKTGLVAMPGERELPPSRLQFQLEADRTVHEGTSEVPYLVTHVGPVSGTFREDPDLHANNLLSDDLEGTSVEYFLRPLPRRPCNVPRAVCQQSMCPKTLTEP
uniref:DUF4408 domain-containing protein n=1 Tax=Panagrellus redivivus TaxID=6233 RepID=A0A7E4VJ48_PANRE